MTKMAEMTTEMTEMAEMAEMDGDDEWMDARRGAEGGKGRHWMVRRVERVRMCGELWMCGVALVCDVFRRMEGGCGLCVACARCELVILWTFERVSHSVVRRERVSSTLEGVCALVATCRFSDPTHVCVRCAYISILFIPREPPKAENGLCAPTLANTADGEGRGRPGGSEVYLPAPLRTHHSAAPRSPGRRFLAGGGVTGSANSNARHRWGRVGVLGSRRRFPVAGGGAGAWPFLHGVAGPSLPARFAVRRPVLGASTSLRKSLSSATNLPRVAEGRGHVSTGW